MTPEILRTSLEDVVLTIASLNLGKASDFLARAVNPPEEASVKAAIGLLLKVRPLFPFQARALVKSKPLKLKNRALSGPDKAWGIGNIAPDNVVRLREV